jgi:hypothetical protein
MLGQWEISIVYAPTSKAKCNCAWIADIGADPTVFHKPVRVESFWLRIFLRIAKNMPWVYVGKRQWHELTNSTHQTFYICSLSVRNIENVSIKVLLTGIITVPLGIKYPL